MKLRSKVAALTMTGAAITGGAAVWAAWNSNVDGTGSAHSRTHDSGDNDIAPVTPVSTDDLYPGAIKATKVTVRNDNPYPIDVLKIRAGSSRTVGSCAADSVRTDELANGGAAVVQSDGSTTLIAPNGGTGTYTLVLRMNNNATDDCKSQDFVIGDRTAPASDLVAEVRSNATTAGNTWP